MKELSEVDGARIEDIRDMSDAPVDARLQALEAARSLAEAPAGAVHERLCDHVRTDTGADWAACIDLEVTAVVAAVGPTPPLDWLTAYTVGAIAASNGAAARDGRDVAPTAELDDTICLPIGGPASALTVGRTGRAFRRRERSALVLLTDLAAARIASCNGSANRTH